MILEQVQQRLGTAVRNFSNHSDEVLRQSARVEEALGRAATSGMSDGEVKKLTWLGGPPLEALEQGG